MKSEGKHFQICLKNMFSNNFVKILLKIHNFPLSQTPTPLVFHSLLFVNQPSSPVHTEKTLKD